MAMWPGGWERKGGFIFCGELSPSRLGCRQVHMGPAGAGGREEDPEIQPR